MLSLTCRLKMLINLPILLTAVLWLCMLPNVLSVKATAFKYMSMMTSYSKSYIALDTEKFNSNIPVVIVGGGT